MDAPVSVRVLRRRQLPYGGGEVVEFACVCGQVIERREGTDQLFHIGRRTFMGCRVNTLRDVRLEDG